MAAVITVIALAGGAGGGYYFANASSESDSSIPSVADSHDADDNGEAEVDDDDPGSLKEGAEDEDEPESLYQNIEIGTPHYPWEKDDESPAYHPGLTFTEDGDIYSFLSPDDHLAYLITGPLNTNVVTMHPDRLEQTVHGIMHEINSHEMLTYLGLHIADVEFTSHEVDGQNALLGETTMTWWTSEDYQEAYADVAVLVVDVGGHEAVGGMVMVPEYSHDHYQPALNLLLEAELS